MVGPQTRAVSILGVQVHDVTQVEAVELLSGFVRKGRPHLVVTPNPEIVMAARVDPVYREILNRADLAIPDGIGLVVASRLAGSGLRAHVRGADLVLDLAARSAREGWRWYLLGAGPGVAIEAGKRLAARYPGLIIAGAEVGTPHPSGDRRAIDAIRAAAPVHVLLVAYGAPRQEMWIARNLERSGAAIQIGVGGAFNFIAGRSARAPTWVRRLELEWAYRLLNEPWRWRRQLALPRFVLAATVEALRRRQARARAD